VTVDKGVGSASKRSWHVLPFVWRVWE